MSDISNMLFKPNTRSSRHSRAVGDFYNLRTADFIEVYGEVIQAFRTNDVNEWLTYTMQSMGLGTQMTVLDAGCGICGPARYYAKQIQDLQITACSISEVQVQQAKEKNLAAGLSQRINVLHLDYHALSSAFTQATFDLVYFLESFGHSANQAHLLQEAYSVLREGGTLYIKDLFKAQNPDDWKQQRIDELCEDINQAYHYHIPELEKFLQAARKCGFRLEWVRIPEVKRETFEHLKISNDFQELFQVGKIETWSDYIFPIDFFEIKLIKPKTLDPADLHKYFMNQDEAS
jgi:ubiquinone/menaquinone biosynthesis C-methylase UbiE